MPCIFPTLVYDNSRGRRMPLPAGGLALPPAPRGPGRCTMTASGAAPRPAPHGHTRRGALAVQPSPHGAAVQAAATCNRQLPPRGRLETSRRRYTLGRRQTRFPRKRPRRAPAGACTGPTRCPGFAGRASPAECKAGKNRGRGAPFPPGHGRPGRRVRAGAGGWFFAAKFPARPGQRLRG